jgi:co-chaperonin GroES (HSP10)
MAELIVVGDRVLIKPREGEQRTGSGLVLPASVAEQENVRGGTVMRTGPGYLTANPDYAENEPWREGNVPVRYLPLQAQAGDFAFFLREKAIELRYNDDEYLIVPHAAILALVREHTEAPSDTTFDDLEDLLGT